MRCCGQVELDDPGGHPVQEVRGRGWPQDRAVVAGDELRPSAPARGRRGRWSARRAAARRTGSAAPRASAARAAWPPESVPSGRSGSTSRPTCPATWGNRSSRSAAPSASHRSRAAAYRWSAPGGLGGEGVGGVLQGLVGGRDAGTPAREGPSSDSCGSGVVSGSQPMVASDGASRMVPASTGSSPTTVRIRLDLPDPFGPTRAVTSPSARTRSRPRTRVRAP